MVHHGFTNLKGVDFVWAPLTPAEYRALPPLGRLMDRIYRSGWTPGLYYMVEIWWKKMFFPSRRQMPSRRAVFLWDNLLVTTFAPAWLLLVAGAIVPFAFWCAMIGVVVYVHHTHVKVSWHDDRPAWPKAKLEELLPGRIVVQRFSWRWYFDTARRCKLYDFTRRCWTDDAGRATSVSAPLPAAQAA